VNGAALLAGLRDSSIERRRRINRVDADRNG